MDTVAIFWAALLMQQPDFYQTRVQPVIQRNCAPCHTPEALRERANRIPQAIRYDGVVKMPPKGRLSDDQIADLTAWAKKVVPLPWAFRAIADPPVPKVRRSEWVESPIDAFVLAKLEAKGLSPAASADRRTLLRRVTFDLTGLPPAIEETEAFVSDPAPDAFARVVDRLLASPHYGERWARHWLDLVRYAETNGHEFDNDKHEPWRYRDYVIRAFNEDVPYNQFVREHIAGDLFASKRLSRDGSFVESPLATGFFWFGEVLNSATDSVKSRADEVDNQIDVAGKAFLGLTVACARCHDHKFDPIPTVDYYGLAGVFHSTALREDTIDSPARARRIRELSARILEHRGPVEMRAAKLRYRPEDTPFEGVWRPAGVAFGEGMRNGVASSLAAGSERFTGTLTSQKFRTSDKLYLHVRRSGTKSDGKLKENGPLRFTSVCDGYKGQHVVPEGANEPGWKTLTLTLERNRACYFEIVDRSTNGHISVEAIVFSSLKDPPPVEDGGVTAALRPCEACAALERELPGSVFAMVASDEDPHNVRVHLRGSHENLGAEVPRHFLQAIAGESQQPLTYGSGRLEAAEWFAGRNNPLTARVMVNRIWKHHFGSGLVRTPDNFGVMGEAPLNPELLDYLASRFIESGWSVKAMHRLMLLSSAYQMSSRGDSQAAKIDPENKLLHHMPVRRLEAEAVRDAILTVARTLKPSMYGPSITPHISAYQEGRGKPPSGPLDGNGRRSIYIQVRRNFITPMFLAFDCPLPTSTIGARGVSTVPSQALMMMNNEFVATQAAAWGRRAVTETADPRERIDRMYRTAFARPPNAAEIEQILGFARARVNDESVWGDIAHVLLNSAEFLYVP